MVTFCYPGASRGRGVVGYKRPSLFLDLYKCSLFIFATFMIFPRNVSFCKPFHESFLRGAFLLLSSLTNILFLYSIQYIFLKSGLFIIEPVYELPPNGAFFGPFS